MRNMLAKKSHQSLGLPQPTLGRGGGGEKSFSFSYTELEIGFFRNENSVNVGPMTSQVGTKVSVLESLIFILIK
jgi:hypothetical protein